MEKSLALTLEFYLTLRGKKESKLKYLTIRSLREYVSYFDKYAEQAQKEFETLF